MSEQKKYLNRLIFGDTLAGFLDEDEINKLLNVELGVEKDLAEEEEENSQQRSAKKPQAVSRALEESKSDTSRKQAPPKTAKAILSDDEKDSSDEVEEGKEEESFVKEDSFEVEVEEEEPAAQDNKDEVSSSSSSEGEDSFERVPEEEDNEPEQVDYEKSYQSSSHSTHRSVKPQTKVDLSVLYRNVKDGEVVYRLTEMYLPKNPDLRTRMEKFNRDLMRTQNDDNSDLLLKSMNVRGVKRDLKRDLKQASLRIKHQIRYCQTPAVVLDEAKHRYTPGVTVRDILQQQRSQRNKYEKMPWIGRLPGAANMTKRPAQTGQQEQNASQVAAVFEESKISQQQVEPPRLKWYLSQAPVGVDLRRIELVQPEVKVEPNQSSGLLDYSKIEQQSTQINPQDSKMLDALFEEIENGTAPTSAADIDPLLNSSSFDLHFQKPLDSTTLPKPQQLALQYQVIMTRLQGNPTHSLVDLSLEERAIVKEYLHMQKQSKVDTDYPNRLENMNRIEKQGLVFMKEFKTEDFSYRGRQSMEKSYDLMGGGAFNIGGGDQDHHGSDNRNNNIFNIGVGAMDDGRFMDALLENNPLEGGGAGGNMFDAPNQDQLNEQRFKDSEHVYNGLTDQELHQLYHQQRLQQALHQLRIRPKANKRRKYWGEPQDCSSRAQIELEAYLHRKALNRAYLERGRRDEELFQVDKNVPANSASQQKPGQNTQQSKKEDRRGANANNANQAQYAIKDLQEYEYIQKQKSHFYADDGSKSKRGFHEDRQLNSIIRHTKFALGEITAEEFYEQEALDEQFDIEHTQKLSKGRVISRADQQSQINLNENFDDHFQRRKKELHDQMLKRLSQSENKTQGNPSGTGGTTTTPYASGKEVLKSISQNNAQQQQQQQQQMQQMEHENEEEKNNEHGLGEGEEHNKHHSHHHQMEVVHDVNYMLRVTKSRANELNHAKCILKLTYNKFEWSDKELNGFHRPDIQEVYESLRMQMLGQQVIAMQLRVPTQEQIEKRSKKIGINAHEYFKDRFKLSLKDGKFLLFEHVDQRPLFVNNFGMASKLKRYVYTDGNQPLPVSEFTKRGNTGLHHMGPYGVQILKKKQERTPLLGQIDPRTSPYRGLTVLENNMYYCPVFYHKVPRNDFLCIVHQDKHGQSSIYARELNEGMYLMGQIEPKNNVEVYNPQSRQYHHFIKRRTQAYVIRFLQENKRISFFELNKFFSYMNDQILKKIIKEINVDVDRNQTCSLQSDYKDEQFRQLINPEQICQYESAQFGEYMLKKVGINDITNADKISYATNKFCSEESDLKKQLIARIIEEEVLSTPWNLSQNFNLNRQQKGMMMLEGIGDPSNGHGGYSYLKLPLKISQDSLNKAKINRMFLNPAIQNPKAVTGTDADLRKLSKRDIQQKLIELNFKRETIEKFTRWEMVALLRDKSSQAVTQGIEGEMKKFARGVRFTSKKQKEMYQKQINDIFKKQISNLTSDNPKNLHDNSDSESRDAKQKKLNEMQQINQNNTKNMVVLKEDIEVKRLQDIPNWEILVMNSINQQGATAQTSGAALSGLGLPGLGASAGFQSFADRQDAKKALDEKLREGATLAVTILRKKIRPVIENTQNQEVVVPVSERKIERVIFCSDLRQIKGFNKRKNKHEGKITRVKKTSLKDKMHQTSASRMMSEQQNKSHRSGDTNLSLRGSLAGRTLGGPQLTKNDSVASSIIDTTQGGSVKISLGGNPLIRVPTLPQTTAAASSGPIKIPSLSMPQQQPSLIQTQPQSNKLTINLSQIPSLPSKNLTQDQLIMPPPPSQVPQQQQQSVSVSLNLGMMNQQNLTQQSSSIKIPSMLPPASNPPQQQTSKISISFGGSGASTLSAQTTTGGSDSYARPLKSGGTTIGLTMSGATSSDGSKKKGASSGIASGSGHTTSGSSGAGSMSKQKSSGVGGQTQSAQAILDEDYESNLYKPKSLQQSRRRQQSGETLLNEVFENIVDYCIKIDKNKLFVSPVKKKDAPNYYEIIRQPMDLTFMKNRSKRLEYLTRDAFEADLLLIQTNAETFNGWHHAIASAAREIVGNAIAKLEEVKDDLVRYETTIKIQRGQI